MVVQKYLHGDTAVKIARSAETAILAGHLTNGDPLPPVRRLAAHCGVSAATAAAAYRILRERGLVVADGRRGTRIHSLSTLPAHSEAAVSPDLRDLAAGNPDPALLPRLTRAFQTLPHTSELYDGPLNFQPLLERASRQFADDAVPHSPVAVATGALDGIERVLREWLRPGDRVAVEDPCFTGVRSLLHALGLVPVPLTVDDEGVLPDALRTSMRKASAIIVTPRAQNPFGSAFTDRRAAVLRRVVAENPDTLLIEDDHAGPVAGAPYRTLVTPGHRRWSVVRSVSKSLGPDLRVAVIAGDALTLSRIEARQTVGIRWVSHLLQRVVASLWNDRAVTRQLLKAEKTYAQRRNTMIEALDRHGIPAHGTSGLNVWVPVPEEMPVVQALASCGWAVRAGDAYRLQSGPAIRVTVATLEATDSLEFASDLAKVLTAGRRPRRTAA